MNSDGTPETELEQFVLHTGLAKIAVQTGSYTPQSKAQADQIEQYGFDPEHDAWSLEALEAIVGESATWNSELRGLVEEWRGSTDGTAIEDDYVDGVDDAMQGCADELEALLDDE